MVAAAAIFATLSRDSLDAAIAGLSISYRETCVSGFCSCFKIEKNGKKFNQKEKTHIGERLGF